MSKYFAEFLGTGILTLAVLASLPGAFPVSTPVVAALTLGLLVYTIGPFSGAHVNPAVTAGLWATGKIRITDAVPYLVSQFLGAWAVSWIYHMLIERQVTVLVIDAWQVGVAEGIGAAILAFGVSAVVAGKVPQSMSGAVVGGSLFIGIAIASRISNGVLNPAVALGIGSFSLAYLLGPLVGGILGAWAFRFLSR